MTGLAATLAAVVSLLGRPADAQASPAAFGSPERAAAPAPPATAPDPQPERRVLVMLRLAPDHYRPTNDYGGAGAYGNAAAALARRRLSERLARDNGLLLLQNWPMPILGVDCVVMQVPGDVPLQAIVDRLARDHRVAWAQPLNRFEAQGTAPTAATAGAPNDRLFAAQPAAGRWRLSDLHRIASGDGVRVAVIDSMADAGHPDLRGQFVTTRDFVGAPAARAEAHGTAVAGIIGARSDNGVGIAGIAPGARIMGLRACWQRSPAATSCDSLSLARALVFALENGAGVVNLSLTGPRDQLIERLVEVGLRRGVSIVAAVDPATGTGFPAAIRGVVAVGSDDLAVTRGAVYNAPGRDIPTTEPGGRWNLVSGTSYAAAHVSGLLALARQVDGRRRSPALVSTRVGGGAVDACATLLRAGARADGRCRPDG